jgi:hypothetical protein
MNTATFGEFLMAGNPIATVKGYAVYDVTSQDVTKYFIVNVATQAVESGRVETSSKMIGNTECVTMVETCAFPSLDTALTAIVDDLIKCVYLEHDHGTPECYCAKPIAHKH